MASALFKIRIRQFYRLMKVIGLLRIIVLLFFLGIFAIILYNILHRPENTWLILFVTGIILFSVHASRKDKKFLKILTGKYRLIFLSEYLLLSSPVMVLWLVFANWKGAGLLLLVCILISLTRLNIGILNVTSLLKWLVNPFQSTLNFKLNIRLPFIHRSSFEWTGGVRKNFVILLPVYLIILGFSFKPFVAPIGLIFFSILISSFYSYGEPREFIELYAANPGQFLRKKIWDNLKNMSIVVLPIVIVAVIFQTEQWYYLAGALLITGFIQIISIIFKYALFRENSDLSSNGMIVFFNVFCIIVPFLWPVPIAMGIRYYFKAQKNLKSYFDVEN